MQQSARFGRHLGQRAAQARGKLRGDQIAHAPRLGGHRAVHLLHRPGLQAGAGNLAGKGVSIGRLTDRLQHGLMDQ